MEPVARTRTSTRRRRSHQLVVGTIVRAAVLVCALGFVGTFAIAQQSTLILPVSAARPDSAQTATPLNAPQRNQPHYGSGAFTHSGFKGGLFDGLRLIPIEPGFEDVSLLATSSKRMPVDLRMPLNFDQIYRIEGDLSRLGLTGRNTSWLARANTPMFARASGGLIAIFPQSEYVQTKRGMRPVVPANTTFFIGTIPHDAVVQPGINAISITNDQSVNDRSASEQTANNGFANDRSANNQAVNPNSATNNQTVAAAAQRNDLRADLRANQVSDVRIETLRNETIARPLIWHSDRLTAGAPAEVTRRTTPTIWTSERLRASRLASLLGLTQLPHVQERLHQQVAEDGAAKAELTPNQTQLDQTQLDQTQLDQTQLDQVEVRQLTPASSP